MNMNEFNKFFGAATAALLVFLLANYASESLYQVESPDQLAYGLEIEEEEEPAAAPSAESGGSSGGESGVAAASGGAEAAAGGEMTMASFLQEASAEDGQKVFRKCSACHKIEEGVNAVGPSLWNVVGREVQAIEDFNYSGALAEQGAEKWDFETLWAYLEDPRGWAPGTSMSFSGLKDPEDRADVIVYLNQAGSDPQPLPEPAPAPAAEAETAPAQETAEAETAEADAASAETEGDAEAPAETASDAAAQEATPAGGEADAEGATADAAEAEAQTVAEAESPAEQTMEVAEATPQGEDEPQASAPAPMTFANALEVVTPAEGEQVAQQCLACHRLAEGEHGIAPSLYGVVGREVGSVKYFPYSDAISELGGVWTPSRLNEYLSDPAAYAPGNYMAFHGLESARDRAAVVVFLNQLDGSPEDLAALDEGVSEPAEAAVEMGEAASEAVETVEQELAEAADAAAKTADAAAETVAEAAGDAGEAVAETAGEAVEAVEETAGEAVETVEETVAEAADVVEETVTGETETAETKETASKAAETAETDAEPAKTEAAEAEPAPAPAETDVAAAEPAPEPAPAPAAGGVAEGVSPEFASALASVSAEDGEKVFRKCRACHKVEEGVNGVGPSLWGVVGRDVASIEDFRYSDAVAGIGGQWTYQKLNEYLTNPRAYAKGTKMAFAGLRKVEDRAAVVKYLNEADGSPEPYPGQ